MLSAFRRLASLYPRVLKMQLLRCLGTATIEVIDDLAAHRQIAQILQVAIERLE